ncbi:MAG: type I glyceraldehyde-3-phosphate dehydrogenase [Coriobacteriales bacterium]|jgi:glyceraldehyde 3-phosphate dehydrogenase|nr:type I glyceraldehyde-3-phosphate dehydrogenase [Coriobacteriales bacterium]
MVRVGINGAGRIGKLVCRIAKTDPNIQVVAINDLVGNEVIAHLLKYDSVHGILYDEVTATDDSIIVDGSTIMVSHERDPKDIPWDAAKVDVVIEATGFFTDAEKAKGHLENSSVKKVIISAPAKNEDITIVIGVNDKEYDKEKHHVISNASCTTNALAPICKIMDDAFGIKLGMMNTIHAVTGDQNLCDGPHKDLRRARASMNIIPTSTGAAKAIGLVMPKLQGKIDGFATRVPVLDGSMVDLTLELGKETTKEEINRVIARQAETSMKGIVEYTEAPIVSSDVIGNAHSCVFDSQMTMVLGKQSNICKLIFWYDNELGYSARLCELSQKLFQ